MSSRADDPGDLLSSVYQELRAVAQNHMKSERADHTLSATALVHEVYVRLQPPRDIPWQNKAHFYAAAVEAMRRVLLDHAKAKNRQKRGGKGLRVDLDAGATLALAREENLPELISLDEALCRLEDKDPRMAQVVELRFYAGLSVEETASVLGVSDRTVKSDWKFARAWLARELSGDDDAKREDIDA
jgi:RNA polymerase sigma-70 factor (ECF subfamily)